MPKKKHQPPARIKYDKTHPVISIRVDKYVKGKLDEIKQMSGKSVGDVVREAIDVQAESAKKPYNLGYAKAKDTYGVWFRCSVCGGSILIDTEGEKKAAAQCMEEHEWAHGSCLQKSN